MTDLHTRFQSLDALRAPDLWSEVEQRATAIQPTRRSSAWVLIAVTLLLALVIGGAILVGSGVIKLPVIVDASASPSSAPSSSAQASAQASSTASASPGKQAAGGWSATGAMTEAREVLTATLLLDGRVLVAGGRGSGSTFNPFASAEIYDPTTRSWTATGSMAEAHSLHAATLLPDGRVLVTGGQGWTGDRYQDVASAELYDPATGSWTATGMMLKARFSHTATLLPDGRVLVTGGSAIDNGPPMLASAEVWDPSSGTWTATESMTEARTGHTATLLPDGKVLVAGGLGTGGNLASAELYDPSSGTWSATGGMIETRIGHTATLLLGGIVLVAGGGASPSSAEVYDPSSESWTAAASMTEARYGHTATLLLDGTVLVAGGGGRASAEVYDPSTGSWTMTGDMIEARMGHTATLLLGGTALVAGGYGNSGQMASAELYDRDSGP
jgi:N-acetylneuraminic acid mutarotase